MSFFNSLNAYPSLHNGSPLLSSLIQLTHFNLSSSVIPINSGIRFLNASQPQSSLYLSLHSLHQPLPLLCIAVTLCVFGVQPQLNWASRNYVLVADIHERRALSILLSLNFISEILDIVWKTVILPWVLFPKPTFWQFFSVSYICS